MRRRDVLLAAVLGVAGSCGCSDGTSHGPTQTPRPDAASVVFVDSATPPSPDAAEEPDATPMPAVILKPAGRAEVRVTVALARTDEERRRGLMYVQHLPPDDGMLFIWDDDDYRYFWMRNTLIPLDMIFIRADMTVAGIVANAVPLDETPRGVDELSRYVLEVNGGWAAAHGVTTHTPLRFEGFTP